MDTMSFVSLGIVVVVPIGLRSCQQLMLSVVGRRRKKKNRIGATRKKKVFPEYGSLYFKKVHLYFKAVTGILESEIYRIYLGR
jgi:hypothetical protein